MAQQECLRDHIGAELDSVINCYVVYRFFTPTMGDCDQRDSHRENLIHDFFLNYTLLDTINLLLLFDICLFTTGPSSCVFICVH